MEIVGRENIAKAGPELHRGAEPRQLSRRAAGLLAARRRRRCSPSIPHIAQAWWIKPFLRFARTYAARPDKAAGDARPDPGRAQRRDSLVIFPEGRLTVTGGLMKVYDGAGHDRRQSRRESRAGAARRAEVAPPFPCLSRELAPRPLVPKVSVTVLEPVELKVDEKLRGKARRMAAGAALYDVMSDAGVPHHRRRHRPCFTPWSRPAKFTAWAAWPLEDPLAAR